MLNKDILDEVTAFAQEIIRINSLSGEEGGVAAAVVNKAKTLGFDRVEVDELGSVFAVREGQNPGPTVLFDSHYGCCAGYEPARMDGRSLWRGNPRRYALRAGSLGYERPARCMPRGARPPACRRFQGYARRFGERR